MSLVHSNHEPLGLSWKVAQMIGVALTGLLVAGLFLRPEMTLNVLWYAVVPILPATFLVSPALWRNVCPLATLNVWTNRTASRSPLSPGMTAKFGVVGVVLLGALVPARRFVFNSDGPVLAVVIIGVAVLAAVSGFIFPVKSGFCNGLCPILPVERLYGHRPLITIPNPRCVPCTTCTVGGCIDLAPRKSAVYPLGRARSSHLWLTTSYGIFAASFPGFVLGYFTVVDGPMSSALGVYLHIALWASLSFGVTAFVVGLINIGSQQAITALAAAGAGIYYWFAASSTAVALSLPGSFVPITRVVTLTLVAVWWLRSSPRVDADQRV
jgi:hypothetical protein